MKHLNRKFLIALSALLVVCGASLSGTALAREAESGSSGSDDSTNTSSHTSQETERSKILKEQFRQNAKVKVQAEAKSKAKVKSQEQKQKACEARKTNLTKRMDNSVAAAERHKAVFDKIYTRLKTFHDEKNLNTPNYDTLTAAIDTAQQDAADKIIALKALEISVDCTQTDSLATNLSAFREAVSSTRDSLKDYRKSIVALTTALHDGDKTKADDSTTNSTTN